MAPLREADEAIREGAEMKKTQNRFKNINVVALFGLAGSLWLGVPGVATADTVARIARESGAVHEEFRNLMASSIQLLTSGTGRLEFRGQSGGDACTVNFFTNPQTTYVTFDVGAGGYYTEFYIDHPSQSFTPILFQNIRMSDRGTAIEVLGRNGDWSVQTDGETLMVSSRKARAREPVTCELALAGVKAHDGEME
jgi:hypothetical protein